MPDRATTQLPPPGGDPWAKKTPEEILADVKRGLASFTGAPVVDRFAMAPDIYIALIKATVKDPYQRLMMLYNAGCRGRDLR